MQISTSSDASERGLNLLIGYFFSPPCYLGTFSLSHILSSMLAGYFSSVTRLDILPAAGGHLPTMHPPEIFHAEGQGNGNTRNNSGKSILTL